MLNLYPPFLFNRIVIRSIAEDWHALELTIERSRLNKNLNGTTFGGSISAAADPIHAILFDQTFARRGQAIRAWTKSSRVDFLRPATARLHTRFELGPGDVDDAIEALDATERFERTYTVEASNPDGEVCARIEVLVHLRRPTPT